jgi:SAM-dependent methyltransferase
VTADETHQRRYSQAIRAARERGSDAFQRWFDEAPSEEEALRRGYWDFTTHILTPAVCERLADPGALTALEIGYGGGRLLNAAATYFGRAIGVDIHEEAPAVQTLLERLGHTNITLLQGCGADIPLDEASVDFVYSFIVFQHLQRFDSFLGYVREAFRVLRPGGVAQVYYGRLRSRNPRVRYRELDVAPNDISLMVSARVARHVCRSAGFTIVDAGCSYKRSPDGYGKVEGSQRYVTLVKGLR